MRVLALDTALSGCSVCLYDANSLQAKSEQLEMNRGQAEALIPMVERVLKSSELEAPDIDLIVTTIGPGAFTGLRIGLAAAQGYALALDVPATGVITTQALAAMYFEDQKLESDEHLAVLIETKRDDFYVQTFDSNALAQTAPQALSREETEQLLKDKNVKFIGDGALRFISDSSSYIDGYSLIDPLTVAKIGYKHFIDGKVRELKPLYLRPADVSKPKKTGRVILND